MSKHHTNVFDYSEYVSENATAMRKAILSMVTSSNGLPELSEGMVVKMRGTTLGFFVVVAKGRKVRGTGSKTVMLVPVSGEFGKSVGRIEEKGVTPISPSDWPQLEMYLDRMGFRREAALYYFLIGNY